MAGFEIGGTGNNGYVPADSTGTSRTRKTPDKKPTLTPEQKRILSEMIRKGKLRPPKTKYGINNPAPPPPELLEKLNEMQTNTKYGINTPKK